MRVLLVEDDPDVAEAVRRGLAAEHVGVSVERDGRSGLESACTGHYDVVVLDIALPALSGYRVLAELRRRDVWTPVLMLTAKDGEYDQADAFDLGADDYLVKPFSFVVLLARLRALVRRAAPQRPAVLTAGDLTLDSATRRVSRGLTAIELTPREFGLLEFLLRHAGRVLTRTEILHGVWDAHYEGDSNVVDVYIRYLRHKIDKPFDRTALETVRGVGYRLAKDGG
ncbi:response regulator transcription factor [Actinophytocola sp.]|jgi:two-component system OmpR family response regulator|uniref:response regulator transcription factor n=1 Tax=Actinophytocola sp. TaxID=1872138 RepID=UPI002ED81964